MLPGNVLGALITAVFFLSVLLTVSVFHLITKVA